MREITYREAKIIVRRLNKKFKTDAFKAYHVVPAHDIYWILCWPYPEQQLVYRKGILKQLIERAERILETRRHKKLVPAAPT